MEVVDDRARVLLGYEIRSAGAGRAVVEMDVREDMLNGLAVCHGGFLFTLADSAMAYASNSHGQDAVAVAASIDFLRPVRVGERLRAAAVEVFRRGRNALYDVDVVCVGSGEVVARFHGRTQHPTRKVQVSTGHVGS